MAPVLLLERQSAIQSLVWFSVEKLVKVSAMMVPLDSRISVLNGQTKSSCLIIVHNLYRMGNDPRCFRVCPTKIVLLVIYFLLSNLCKKIFLNPAKHTLF